MDKSEVMENLLVINGMVAAIEAMQSLPMLYGGKKTLSQVLIEVTKYVERSVDLEKYLRDVHVPRVVLDVGTATEEVKKLLEEASLLIQTDWFLPCTKCHKQVLLTRGKFKTEVLDEDYQVLCGVCIK